MCVCVHMCVHACVCSIEIIVIYSHTNISHASILSNKTKCSLIRTTFIPEKVDPMALQ